MDTTNSATGLTEREKDAVRENWKKLAASWKTNGIELFIRLFENYPKIRAAFKTFDGMEIEEIRKSTKLRAHIMNFKLGLASFVDNLDDEECLVILIQKQAANHFRRHIRIQEFKDAFGVFVKLVQDVTDANEFTTDAWTKTLDVIAAVMEEHMATLENQAD